MSILVLLVPLAVILAGCALAGFLWSVRSGQLDDMTTPALRILHDEGTLHRPSGECVPGPSRSSDSDCSPLAHVGTDGRRD